MDRGHVPSAFVFIISWGGFDAVTPALEPATAWRSSSVPVLRPRPPSLYSVPVLLGSCALPKQEAEPLPSTQRDGDNRQKQQDVLARLTLSTGGRQLPADRLAGGVWVGGGGVWFGRRDNGPLLRSQTRRSSLCFSPVFPTWQRLEVSGGGGH